MPGPGAAAWSRAVPLQKDRQVERESNAMHQHVCMWRERAGTGYTTWQVVSTQGTQVQTAEPVVDMPTTADLQAKYAAEFAEYRMRLAEVERAFKR